MVSVAFAISTIPARAAMCRDLRMRLEGEIVRVYCDDPPSGSAWGNYRRMLEDAGKDGETWLVGLDDDAILCAAFRTAVRKALRVCPADIASFYVANKRVMQLGLRSGASWIQTMRAIHGLCWALRAELAGEVLEVNARAIAETYHSGDQRLLAWAAIKGRKHCTLIPSIVDHREEGQSALYPEFANRGRVAACFDPNPMTRTWDSSTFVFGDDPQQALSLLTKLGAFG